MKTPVYDFVQAYLEKDSVRFHMPGHKGEGALGCEKRDITEIDGADVLSVPTGILEESQCAAAALFQTDATYYSTEGSSLSIKAMLAAALMDWKRDMSSLEGVMSENEKEAAKSSRPWILAAPNVHRAMIDGCALLDLDVEFIACQAGDSICSLIIDPQSVEHGLQCRKNRPVAVYLTSPDYLGMQTRITEIANLCHRDGIPLLVDNAHGAYLAFLEGGCHPIHQGADLCCDSAHKTLPVLTGGSYLHVAKGCGKRFAAYIPRAMAVFGSTSPSYLILQSLDLCNRYLKEKYSVELQECAGEIDKIKSEMRERGFVLYGTEALKIVIDTASSGYSAGEIAEEMRKTEFSVHGRTRYGIECEYAGEGYVVCMITPQNSREDLECMRQWMCRTRLNMPKSPVIRPFLSRKEGIRRMTIREAVLAPSERIAVSEAEGRILAQETVSCPPAVPIGISGEEVTAQMVSLYQAYGIEEIDVVT